MSDVRVTLPPSGGWAVHVPIGGGPGTLVLQWIPAKRVWRSGTGASDDPVDPACTQQVPGLVEEPQDGDDAVRIVSEWLADRPLLPQVRFQEGSG